MGLWITELGSCRLGDGRSKRLQPVGLGMAEMGACEH